MEQSVAGGCLRVDRGKGDKKGEKKRRGGRRGGSSVQRKILCFDLILTEVLTRCFVGRQMTSCFVSGSSSLLWRVRSSLAVTRERRSCRVVRRRGLVVKAHSGAIWEEGKEADCCGSSEISIFSKGKKINHVHRNHSDHDHDHEHEHGHDHERSHADHYDGGNHALSHNSIPRSTFG